VTIYVDSAAGGANDGTSWTDAYTSFASADGAAAAGEKILVDDGHVESIASATTYNFTNGTDADPVIVVSVDNADDSYSTGANIANATAGGRHVTIQGVVQMFGITMSSTSSANDFFSNSLNAVYEDCSFTFGDKLQVTLSDEQNVFRNCTISVGRCDFIGQKSVAKFIGCTITTSNASIAFFLAQDGIELDVIGCDLSGLTASKLIDGHEGLTGGRHSFRRCELQGALTIDPYTTPEGNSILVESCTSGAITVPELGITQRELYGGRVKSSTSQYRTDGATDGESVHSWEMTTDASLAQEVYVAIESPSIARWVDGGSSITVTVFVASGGTLNDDDFWIEMLSPNETASPNQTSQANFYSSRVANPQATPAALTTDASSNWDGSGVGTKQEISRTFTPTEAGPVSIRCYLAKPLTTVYVDPRIEVT